VHFPCRPFLRIRPQNGIEGTIPIESSIAFTYYFRYLESVLDARSCSVSFQLLSDASSNKASKRASDLFGPHTDSPIASSWNHTVLEFVCDTVHKGLPDSLRSKLLSEHEVKGDLTTLGPPKINKLLIPTLKGPTSALKRDEAQSAHQSQLAAALNAFSSGVST